MLAMLPDAYWDAYLLRRFPGKTLEELDTVEWPRLMRAQQVRAIEQVEELLPLFFKGKYEPSPDEWRMIRRHDSLHKTLEGSGDRLNQDV